MAGTKKNTHCSQMLKWSQRCRFFQNLRQVSKPCSNGLVVLGSCLHTGNPVKIAKAKNGFSFHKNGYKDDLPTVNHGFRRPPTYNHNPSSFLPNHLFLCMANQTNKSNKHTPLTAAAPQPQPVAHAKLLGPSHALICPHHRRWCDCLPGKSPKVYVRSWDDDNKGRFIQKLLAGWAYSKGVVVGFC